MFKVKDLKIKIIIFLLFGLHSFTYSQNKTIELILDSSMLYGPVITPIVAPFYINNDNPTNFDYNLYNNPNISASFSFQNIQLSSSNIFPNPSVSFGAKDSSSLSAGSSLLYLSMNDANSSFFSSLPHLNGSGIDGKNKGANLSFSLSHYAALEPTINAWWPANGAERKTYVGDFVITFSSPISNPIIHFSDIGANFGGYSSSLDFILADTQYTLQRLSGNSYFQLNGDTIYHSGGGLSSKYGSGLNAAIGSCLLSGDSVLSIRFKVFQKIYNNPTVMDQISGISNWINSFHTDNVLISVSAPLEIPVDLYIKSLTASTTTTNFGFELINTNNNFVFGSGGMANTERLVASRSLYIEDSGSSNFLIRPSEAIGWRVKQIDYFSTNGTQALGLKSGDTIPKNLLTLGSRLKALVIYEPVVNINVNLRNLTRNGDTSLFKFLFTKTNLSSLVTNGGFVNQNKLVGKITALPNDTVILRTDQIPKGWRLSGIDVNTPTGFYLDRPNGFQIPINQLNHMSEIDVIFKFESTQISIYKKTPFSDGSLIPFKVNATNTISGSVTGVGSSNSNKVLMGVLNIDTPGNPIRISEVEFPSNWGFSKMDIYTSVGNLLNLPNNYLLSGIYTNNNIEVQVENRKCSEIVGKTSICIGSTYSYFASNSGGTWSVSDTSRATINQQGVLTPLSMGEVDVIYTELSGVCKNSIKVYIIGDIASGLCNECPSLRIDGGSTLCPNTYLQLSGIPNDGNYVSNKTESFIFANTSLQTSKRWTTNRTKDDLSFYTARGPVFFIDGSNQYNINGYLKHIASASNQPYSFPVGYSNDIRLLNVNGNRSSNSILSVAWIPGDPSVEVDPTNNNEKHSVFKFSAGLAAISKYGQWDFTEHQGSFTGSITVRIPDLTQFADSKEYLRLVGWDGNQWINLSGNNGATGLIEDSELTGNYVAGIQAIGIGTTQVSSNYLDVSNTTSASISNGTWTSSDPSIASVSNSGLVKGNSQGTVFIKFTNPQGCEYSKEVKVTSSSASLDSQTFRTCINQNITNTFHIAPGVTAINPPIGLPEGTTAILSSDSILITGIPTISGTFRYKIPIVASCGIDTIKSTLIVNPTNSVSGPIKVSNCVNKPLTTFSHQTTGVSGIGVPMFLPPGVVANFINGVVLISGTPTAIGTYNYTIPLLGGCGNIAATGTIIVSDTTKVGDSISKIICQYQNIDTIKIPISGASSIANPNGLPKGLATILKNDSILIYGKTDTFGSFSFSIDILGGCNSAKAKGSFLVRQAPSYSGSDSNSFCVNVPIVPLEYTLYAVDSVGQPLGLPNGLVVNHIGNKLLISGTPSALPGIYNFSIPINGGCGSNILLSRIEIVSNTLVSPGVSSKVCVNRTINPIYHFVSGASAIDTPINIPSGLSVSFNNRTIIISGTANSKGVYNYSIPLKGGCSQVSATGTIQVNDLSVFNANDTFRACVNQDIDSIWINILYADTIGLPSNLPPGINAEFIANKILLTGKSTVTGNYNFSIPVKNVCSDTFYNATFIINPLNSFFGDTNASVCQGSNIIPIVFSTFGPTGIGMSSNLPPGLLASFSNGLVSISGIPTLAGSYSYTIPLLGGCQNSNISGIITVNPTNTVSGFIDTAVCDSTYIELKYITTGATGISNPIGLPASINAYFQSDTITVKGIATPSNIYNYSIGLVGGCGTSSAQGRIEVKPNPFLNNVFEEFSCGPKAFKLSGNSNTNAQIYWYNDPILDSIIHIGKVFNTPTIFTDTVFYLSSTLNGCNLKERKPLKVTIDQIPSIYIDSLKNPTKCKDSSGIIYIGGNLLPLKTYQLHMRINGVIQTPTIIKTDSFGNFSIHNLSSDSITIKVSTIPYGCESQEIDTFLVDPTLNPIAATFVSPSICGASDASITILNLDSMTDYIMNYSFNGVVQPRFSFNSGNSTKFIFDSLSYGVYSNIFLEKNNCKTNSVVVNIPNPNPHSIAFDSVANQSLCGTSNGLISIKNLIPNVNYTLSYSRNGVPVSPTNFLATSSLYTLSNLSYGTYTSIKLVYNNCNTNALDTVITRPPFIISATNTPPTTCIPGSDGSIRINGLQRNVLYILNYSKNGSPIVGTPFLATDTFRLISNLTDGFYSNIRLTQGSCVSNQLVQIIPKGPSILQGDSVLCQLDTISLIASPPSGIFSSSNNNILFVNSLGVVEAKSAGMATITYQSPEGCLAEKIITVNSKPYAGIDKIACAEDTVTFLPIMYSGSGTWSASQLNPSGAAILNSADSLKVGFSSVANGNFDFILSDKSCLDTLTVSVYPKPTIAPYRIDTVCVGDSLSIVFNTTNVNGIDTTIGLPNSLSAIFANNMVSVSGLVSNLGIFDYSIGLDANCKKISANGRIVVLSCSKVDTQLIKLNSILDTFLACPTADDIIKFPGIISYSSCNLPSGFWWSDIDSTTGCRKIAAQSPSKDTNYFCMIACKNGICDTTIYKIISSLDVKLSGFVVLDINGPKDNKVSGSDKIPSNLNVVLTDANTNRVLSVYPLGLTNYYEFTVKQNGSYQLILTFLNPAVGALRPNPILPGSFRHTAQSLGSVGHDGLNDGRSSVISFPSSNMTSINFGIKRFIPVMEP